MWKCSHFEWNCVRCGSSYIGCSDYNGIGCLYMHQNSNTNAICSIKKHEISILKKTRKRFVRFYYYLKLKMIISPSFGVQIRWYKRLNLIFWTFRTHLAHLYHLILYIFSEWGVSHIFSHVQRRAAHPSVCA